MNPVTEHIRDGHANLGHNPAHVLWKKKKRAYKRVLCELQFYVRKRISSHDLEK
jgi:hypothetical protein